ncbi:MAG TPA: FAD/NAD(P)-binding protein [Spirochaetia bacterium]|nr:FAD/NAD(P)-binding protein [Spirochaetia bacterium]
MSDARRPRNPYLPLPVTIDDVVVENDLRDIKTFRLTFDREKDRAGFTYLPGQFAELSLCGAGESPIGIASSPTEDGFLLFSVKRTGVVTRELHASAAGRKMGVRGPLGHPFPWQRMEGKNLLIVSGGFAFTTLRSSIVYMLDPSNRARFGRITAVYGARDPGELLYKRSLGEWTGRPDIEFIPTVDREAAGWTGKVGLVPNVVKELAPASDNALAVVCGPPIMIRFTIPVLLDLGFAQKDIILSLENRMKCGMGTCGRCNVGPKYVCKDGPVFTYSELEGLPAEY